VNGDAVDLGVFGAQSEKGISTLRHSPAAILPPEMYFSIETGGAPVFAPSRGDHHHQILAAGLAAVNLEAEAAVIGGVDRLVRCRAPNRRSLQGPRQSNYCRSAFCADGS
jgi:hypothetical protein